MSDASWTSGPGADDGWGPATSVRTGPGDDAGRSSGSALRRPEPPVPAVEQLQGSARERLESMGSRRSSRRATKQPPRGTAPTAAAAANADPFRPAADPFQPAADPFQPAADPFQPAADPYQSAAAPSLSRADLARMRDERGFSAWIGVAVVVAITVLGLVIDSLRGVQLGTGFNLGVIIGSVASILVVRRSSMFPIVVAPPIVYSLGAGISLYLRSNGLADRGALIDAATNWLVYGFPAIAGATAAVLIIAGLRLIVRK